MSALPMTKFHNRTGMIMNMQRRELALYAAHPRETLKYLTLLEPLNGTTWTMTLVTILCVCIVLIVLNHFGIGHSLEETRNDLFTISMVVFGTMINESLPGKLVALKKSALGFNSLIVIWIPCSCLIGMAYQSNLLAFLVKTSKEKPIDTFQDILERDMTVFLPSSTISAQMLKTSKLPLAQEVYQKSFVEKNGSYNFTPRGTAPRYVFREAFGRRALIDSINVRDAGIGHNYRKGKSLVLIVFPLGYICKMYHPLMEGAQDILHTLADSGVTGKARFLGANQSRNTVPKKVCCRSRRTKCGSLNSTRGNTTAPPLSKVSPSLWS